MRVRRLEWLLGSMVVAAVVAGCGGGGSGAAPAAPPAASPAAASGTGGAPQSASAAAATPPALESVRIVYTTIAAAQAPFWVAEEAGYFREQGLDVPPLQRVEPGATLLAALHNGEVDFVAAGGPSLVLGYLQGLETMILGSTQDVIETEIVVQPDIRSVEELRGKIIAVSRLKAISDLAARLGIERYGLDPDRDVQIRGTGGNAESLAALQTGTVAAASLSVPAVFEAHRRGFPTLIDVTAMRIPFTNGSVGATKSTLDRRQPAAEKVLRALAQATARFKTDREFAARVVGKYSQIEDPDALRGTVEVYAPLMQVDPYPSLSAVQAVLDAEENPAARTTRPEQVVDLRAAEALRRSGFLDRLPKE